MNKTKHILFLSIISLFCLDKVHAACTKEELDAFKQVEDKFTAVYKLELEQKTNSLTICNPNWNKYKISVDFTDMPTCKYDEGCLKCIGVKTGNYNISLEGNTNTCDDILKTISIKVSQYNEYYEDPLCEGIEEFVLCQAEYDKEIDYETFKSRVNTYRKSKKKEQEKQQNGQKQEENNEIINYIENNKITIIVVSSFAILVVITIVLTINSIKKSRRLE